MVCPEWKASLPDQGDLAKALKVLVWAVVNCKLTVPSNAVGSVVFQPSRLTVFPQPLRIENFSSTSLICWMDVNVKLVVFVRML